MTHVASQTVHPRELRQVSAALPALSFVEAWGRHKYELGKLIESRSDGVVCVYAARGTYTGVREHAAQGVTQPVDAALNASGRQSNDITGGGHA